MHEETITLFSQAVEDRSLAFTVEYRGQAGILTADGFKPQPSRISPSARRQDPSIRIHGALLKSIQSGEADSAFLDKVGESVQLLVVVEYVLLSYCYCLFDMLPILWLYVPNQIRSTSLLEILPQFCFNGYRVYPYDRVDKIKRRLKAAGALVFEDTVNYSKRVRGYWLDYPIDRSRALETWEKPPLYSPEIVISRDLPPETSHLHTVEISHLSLALHGLFTDHDLQGLRTLFVAMAFEIDKAITADEPSPEIIHPYERQLQALRTINRSLQNRGLLSLEAGKKVNSFLDQQIELASRRSQLFPEFVLEAVADFLAQKQVRYQMRRNENFVALRNIVEDLHRHTQVRPNFNEWYLSRLLRGERIIIGKPRLQRIRVKEKVNGKVHEVTKQVTFVKIDKSRLNHLIMSIS
ncbi:MAG: hypothetical protein IH971_10050 [Candidatus Marinimicrobia bacterium]|nr:hypothetical protein [Candidatus Neomarinimicrobiota bacterium]